MATAADDLPTPPNDPASKHKTAQDANNAAIEAAKKWLKEFVKDKEMRTKVEDVLTTRFNTLHSENKACDGSETDGCPKHTVMMVGEFCDLTNLRKPFNLKVTFDVDIKTRKEVNAWREKEAAKRLKDKNKKAKKPEDTKSQEDEDHMQAPHIGWELVKDNEVPVVRVKPKAQRGNLSKDDKRLLNDDTGHCYIEGDYQGARRPLPSERKDLEGLWRERKRRLETLWPLTGNNVAAREEFNQLDQEVKRGINEASGKQKLVVEVLDLGLRDGLTVFYTIKNLCVVHDNL